MFEAYKRYVDFQGRSRRKEYWLFALWAFISTCLALLVDSMIFRNVGLLYVLVSLGNFLPSLSVGVRRLHDTNRSGWWLLLAFLPLVGVIVLIVFLCTKSDEGVNRFGPPDGVTEGLAETFA